MPRRALAALLKKTVNDACRAIDRTPVSSLGARFSKQGFHTIRIRAIAHVTKHFARHAGQILYITKLKLGRDLGFTRLPKEKRASTRPIPAVAAAGARRRRPSSPRRSLPRQ